MYTGESLWAPMVARDFASIIAEVQCYKTCQILLVMVDAVRSSGQS